MSAMKTYEDELESIFTRASQQNEPISGLASRGYVLASIEKILDNKNQKQRILFVGINPSFPESEKPGSYTFKPHEVVKLYPQYYNKFQVLSDLCNIPEDWTYIDLLQVRETDQKIVKSLIKEPNGANFICDQLRVSMTMMEDLKPDLIVVCNSGARPFFGIERHKKGENEYDIWMGYEFKFNERFGVDVITGLHEKSIKKGLKSTSLIGTPVLFSGILKYTDSSSFKRLAWQMRTILKYHHLFFGPDNLNDDGNHEVNTAIYQLVEKMRQLENKKMEEVIARNYEKAADCRDDFHKTQQELLNILIKHSTK
jgi:hypothetical protein